MDWMGTAVMRRKVPKGYELLQFIFSGCSSLKDMLSLKGL